MKLSMIQKTKAIMIFMFCCLLSLTLLLTRSFVINKSRASDLFDNKMSIESINRLTIRTNDGKDLYSKGTFSDDLLLRESTFQLIGDKNDGITNSIIARERKQTIVKNKKTNRYFQDVNIELTIDSTLQKAAFETLNNYNKGNGGCIIINDYTSGEIKAMVSYPSLDVNNIQIIPEGAYLNKALYSYVPGSVFKAVSVAAVLEKQPMATSFSYYCSGKSEHISCLYPHGSVNLERALMKSCNCAISNFTEEYLTPEELEEFANRMGLCDKEQIVDLPCNMKGNLNAAEDFKWTANGQGKTLLTPISVCRYYSIIANNGRIVPLHIKTSTSLESRQLLSQQTACFIADSLTGVIDSKLSCNAFGKTGTAQINDAESHSWFVCSLYDDNAPTYTILTFLENGGSSINAKDLTLKFISENIL